MFVRHARLPLICRRSSLFKQLVFGVQSVKVVRKPRKNPATVSSFQIKVAVRGHAHPSPCWCEAGWEDYCYCLFAEFNISIFVPAIFLDWTMMHHNGYHFVELLFCMKRSSRILSINCGSRVVLGLKWFECLQVKTSSFPRATDSEPNRVTVFLACKTAPNSRRSSVFKQTMQFWIWYLQPKWILWNFWHWHSCKVCKQGDPVSPKDEFNAAVRVKDLND